MKQLFRQLTAMVISCCFITAAQATTPEEDLKAFQNFYKKRFPNVETTDYINGAYSIDPVGRENWEAIEEFPPYEPFIDEGQAIWEKPFANGKTFKDCFPDGPALGGKYPRWEKEKSMVMTLPLALNNCLEANGEKPMKYKKGPINDILSYIAFESRGQITNVEIPTDDPGALAAYESGKKFYYTRRGQLNFACAHCHLQNAGMILRTEILSPALGHTTHFPVYRSKWGTVGTLHRRFTGCNKQVRAKPFKAHGEEYRNLEYFLTYMSNGLPLNGPGARK
ncbi:MAG: sulfur oxidation c-type cytochrome SoxA [Candidatus Thiodiazotropha sp. (ex Lucina aurantia)]|uniref:SoxAX cytochrome complex subunit A n=2 Tax=Candidatus Thiodiazotropha TaxID=1913444 RepID=A0A7Z0VJP4_9GAMM|nr:sulfur oxidation c-type cytochrome SoxA [Candidatus Thiodiazotropha endolucinida]MBT3011166.1 sulfur oxidation c-type cytochrome SoxA [Candidatus Thiodiazotropha sp. (ex Lucina pensylvanica)]MBT3015485.1 sulfur oxidation c-type cytochrome SoxA [Candidatus Thiodiazotropha taylori]MBT3040264.1 sulfur oxidation c-type cytochrome SoxA [Candidatus Thiodiazotropha sp. (ex Codakia orbicularis)]MBV2103108.1 sulfur oxidation c-type cytochrome SoxA [Candidatus Thiodiazotropha sp. (ex Lucina aurantia)]